MAIYSESRFALAYISREANSEQSYRNVLPGGG